MRAAGAVAYRAWYGVDDDARPQEGMVSRRGHLGRKNGEVRR